MSDDTPKDTLKGPRALPNKERDKLQASIEQHRRVTEHFEEIAKLTARRRWMQYQAYLEAGFSGPHALELVAREIARAGP